MCLFFRATGAAICALGLTLGAHAQTAPPAGRLLASNCFQCHGTNARGSGFDSIADKSAAEIYKELKEFQSGREGNSIMAKHAMGFTDAQMLSLANWLASQR